MSLKPEPIQDVPELTAEIARTAFPKGNIYLQLRAELGPIYKDELFADLYAHDGQPAASPWRLALITVLQFAEKLTRSASGRGGSRPHRLEIFVGS